MKKTCLSKSESKTKLCLSCKKEFEGRATKKFCSDNCRLAFHRASNTPNNETVNETVKTPKKMVDYDDISEEELMLDLENKDVSTLLEESYTIPNWKRHGCKSRDEAFADLLRITQQHQGKYVFQGLEYTI